MESHVSTFIKDTESTANRLSRHEKKRRRKQQQKQQQSTIHSIPYYQGSHAKSVQGIEKKSEETVIPYSSSISPSLKKRSYPRETKSVKMTLIYQDTVKKYKDDDNDDISLAFFELANSTKVGYRVSSFFENNENKKTLNDNGKNVLVFKQDISACGNHTGGIIWETSYLLLEYLILKLQNDSRHRLGNVLEVGSGCGLLGLGLVAVAPYDRLKSMVLTETEPVINNLQCNMDENISIIQHFHHDTTQFKRIVNCCRLDWTDFEKDCKRSDGKLQAHVYDTVIGTDVLFTPSLVGPLLETLRWATHQKSIVYICIQIRCSMSHELFQSQSEKYGFIIENVSDQIYNEYPAIQWGRQLECILFRMKKSTRSALSQNTVI